MQVIRIIGQFLPKRLRGNIYCGHFAKKILGREDYDWGFRKFEQKINSKTWEQHDGILKLGRADGFKQG